jgi:hypothetical protein
LMISSLTCFFTELDRILRFAVFHSTISCSFQSFLNLSNLLFCL